MDTFFFAVKFAEWLFSNPKYNIKAKSHITICNCIIKSYNTWGEKIQLNNYEIARFTYSVVYDLWGKIVGAKIQQPIIIQKMDFVSTTFTFLIIVTSIVVFMKSNVSENRMHTIQRSDVYHNSVKSHSSIRNQCINRDC